MTQLSLFDQEQVGNLVREVPSTVERITFEHPLPDMRGQPPAMPVATSQDAADRIRDIPKTKKDQRALMEWLIQRSGEGATDDEIKDHFGWDGDYERPRRWTLCKHGLVVASGRTRKTKDGFPAIVWVAI